MHIRKKNNPFLTISLIVLTGCSSPHSIMQSWVGHKEAELYQRWGQPTKIIDKGSDGKIVIYINGADNPAESKYSFCDYTFKTNCIPPNTKEYKKVKLLYITPMGNIYAWKMQPPETFHL